MTGESRRKMHYCISGIIATAFMVLLVMFHIGKYECIAFAAMAVVTYPYMDLTVLDFPNRYRIGLGVITAIVMPIILVLGGILIHFGPVFAAIGFIIPVLNYMIVYMLPPRYRASGWFIPMYYVTGMSMVMSLHTIYLFALSTFLGFIGVTLFYVAYYTLFAKKFTQTEEKWFITLQNIKSMFKEMNPRIIRYGIILYISCIIAYAVSLYFQKKHASFVDSAHTYWATYFVMLVLQFTDESKMLYKRVVYRFFGTLIGLGIGMTLFILIPNINEIRVTYIIATILLLWVAYQPKTYFHFQCVVNPYLLFMYIGLLDTGSSIVRYRWDETLVGLTVSLIAIMIIYPIIKKIMPVEKWKKFR